MQQNRAMKNEVFTAVWNEKHSGGKRSEPSLTTPKADLSKKGDIRCVL